MWESFRTGRGSPADFDPGPPTPWAELFAQTPNYRGLGLAFSGDEFRWHFGPMFYRGRLADGGARVLVIGQEGAADESLSHRSFTGETGARLQHLLNHLGVPRSYLFLNTFVYPINGQYDGGFPALAQDPRSPIAQHRARILDLALATQDLRLVVAVGKAAKQTAVSWLRTHGGHGDPNHLETADGSVLAPGVRLVGVPHPGAAGAGGDVAPIAQGFRAAATAIEGWAGADPGWLPPDPGAHRSPAAAFEYREDPVPFRDFPFGISWRLGAGRTTSVRRDGQTAIEVSSSAAADRAGQGYAITAGSAAGYHQDAGDVAVEPPRAVPTGFDPGPTGFADLLAGAAPGLDWPDFAALGLSCHPSFGFGAACRGRLASPSVLVLADQASHDDLFTARALTGEAGQRLAGWLLAAGLTSRYAVLRVLPVDTLGAPPAAVTAAADHPQVRAILAAVLAKSAPRVVLALGEQAGRIVADVVQAAALPPGLPVLRMPAWSPSAVADWRGVLEQLSTLDYPKDGPASFAWDGRRSQIPRADLPYGTLRWQGSGGDRADRAKLTTGTAAEHYKVALPAWTAALKPSELTAAEQAAVDAMKAG